MEWFNSRWDAGGRGGQKTPRPNKVNQPDEPVWSSHLPRVSHGTPPVGGGGIAAPAIEWHERFLPPPLHPFASILLWHQTPFADEWLTVLTVVLLILAVVQTKAFARPPPVPLKRLPKRPCLSIQFQPEDPRVVVAAAAVADGPSAVGPTAEGNTHNQSSSSNTARNKSGPLIQRLDSLMSKRWFRNQKANNNNINNNHASSSSSPSSKLRNPECQDMIHSERRSDTAKPTPNRSTSAMLGRVETVILPDDENDECVVNSNTSNHHGEDDYDDAFSMLDYDDDDDDRVNSLTQDEDDHDPMAASVPVETTFSRLDDLPDSFAPLLSSSHTTVLTHRLTADLVHAVQLEAGVRLRPGRHEIPLDKDSSRPQLIFNVTNASCRVSAVVVVGSDGLDNAQDMQVARPTVSRSKPMVKHAGLVIDPPLALSNVAPTLIHFPTLFEDRHMIPVLRSMQLVRFLVDFVVSISSFLEKCLWILESQCQIHLSKVRITPLYKGRQKIHLDEHSPEWRLQLAFSGHVLLMGWIPIPFISVTLPSFIIPQPHALLEYLISSYVIMLSSRCAWSLRLSNV